MRLILIITSKFFFQVVKQREHFLSSMFAQFQQIYIESFAQEGTMQLLMVQKCPYTKFQWFHSGAYVCLGVSETMRHRPWQGFSTDLGCKYFVSCSTWQLQALHLRCQDLFAHQLQPKVQWHKKNAHFSSHYFQHNIIYMHVTYLVAFPQFWGFILYILYMGVNSLIEC